MLREAGGGGVDKVSVDGGRRQRQGYRTFRKATEGKKHIPKKKKHGPVNRYHHPSDEASTILADRGISFNIQYWVKTRIKT